jgi:hypothetical protein
MSASVAIIALAASASAGPTSDGRESSGATSEIDESGARHSL